MSVRKEVLRYIHDNGPIRVPRGSAKTLAAKMITDHMTEKYGDANEGTVYQTVLELARRRCLIDGTGKPSVSSPRHHLDISEAGKYELALLMYQDRDELDDELRALVAPTSGDEPKPAQPTPEPESNTVGGVNVNELAHSLLQQVLARLAEPAPESGEDSALVATLRQSLEEAQKALQRDQEALQAAQGAIETLERSRETLSTQVDELIGERNEARAKLGRVNGALAQANARIEELQRELQNTDRRNGDGRTINVTHLTDEEAEALRRESERLVRRGRRPQVEE